jgi:hypothetical protein
LSLGEKLGAYIEARRRKQTEVAAAWLEAWKKQGGPSRSDTTVHSQLSRLLNNQSQGVRFFFSDRARGALLLEVLAIPTEERPLLFELAESALKSEGTPARLIVDATSWPQAIERADALFANLSQGLLAQGPFPIALVVLEEQYARLTLRFFEEYKDKLRYVRVQTPDEGWERTQELAEEQGLVVSARRFEDFERWLAADFDGRWLRFEPENGLELFRASGRLPGLEEVQHDLSELVPEGQEKYTQVPNSPREIHSLMHALRSEKASAQLRMSAASRQWIAKKLGITATSTAQERLEAAIDALAPKLPVSLTTCSEDELKNHLTRANRRRVGPLALRVGNTVHLLNLGADTTAHTQDRPWVQVYDIQPKPTPLSRLLEVVDQWTEGDFLADPFLEHLIERLDPDRKERSAFLHARAGLVLTKALKPKPTPYVSDWHSALAELLSGAPPRASLRIHVRNSMNDENSSSDYGGIALPTFVLTEARLKLANENRPKELHQLPPLADLLLTRNDTLVGFQGHIYDYYSDTKTFSSQSTLPKDPKTARDSESWLDAFEGVSPQPRQKTPGYTTWVEKLPDRLSSQLPEWKTQPLQLRPDLWQEADLELAFAWIALRRALSTPQHIQLPDGAILLHTGGPFFAELRITPLAHTSPHPSVLASLLLEIPWETVRSKEEQTVLPLDFRHVIATHTVKGSYDFGARLPLQISLIGARFYATIRFRGSALFADTSSSIMPAAAAVARSEDEHAEEEEERRRQDDDDDDYDDSDDY